MTKHAKYSASKASRIIRCPGSEDFVGYLIQTNKIPKEESSGAADEGSWLHTQQEADIQNEPLSEKLDAEQLSCITANRDWLLKLQQEHDLTWMQTERLVDLEGYDIEEAGGTADVIAGNGKKSLHIIDWKFGKGIPVYVEKNEQLMLYLLGAAENLENLEQYEELWIHLGQPRLDYFGSYQCSVSELMGLINALKNAIKSYDIIAGEIQCFWCRGKTRCGEYDDYIRDHAAVVFKTHDLMAQNEIDFHKMAKALTLEPMFKKAFKAIRDEIERLPSGQLAKLKLKRVAGRSTRSYVSEDSVVEHLCENYSDVTDIYSDPVLKSPAQIEKIIPGIKKDPQFKKLIHKPLGKPTITGIDDPREEYSNDASLAFSHLAKDK